MRDTITPINRLLSWLLMSANTDPGILRRDEFYAIKERLLMRYGTIQGTEIQHIKKDCFTCDGTGEYEPEVDCYKCWGTGVYQEFWVKLISWDWNGYSFHQPVERKHKPFLSEDGSHVPITHEGYITKLHHWAANESRLWLFLLFDRKTFFRAMKSSCQCRPRLPLSIIQKIVFDLRLLPSRVRHNYWSCLRKLRCFLKPVVEVEGYEDIPF
jgi:hypothetical protein